MFGAILNATNSSFQRGMTFCRSIYVRKVMKLLAFIFEQPSFVLLTQNNPEKTDPSEYRENLVCRGKLKLKYE